MSEEQRTSVGGEAQELRSLTESKITLTLGSVKIEGLQVAALLHVLPEQLEESLTMPVEKSFKYPVQKSTVDPDRQSKSRWIHEYDRVHLTGGDWNGEINHLGKDC